MRLDSGYVWSIPITLPITEELAGTINIGDEVALTYKGSTYGAITVSDIFTPNKEKEAELVYGTTDRNHPGVNKMLQRGNVYVGGKITLTKRIERDQFSEFHLDPGPNKRKIS